MAGIKSSTCREPPRNVYNFDVTVVFIIYCCVYIYINVYNIHI